MKIKTFPGGYHFKGFEGQPKNLLINLDIPPKIIIPLSNNFETYCKPQIRVGEKVCAGQIIAHDDTETPSSIHASASGKVIAIQKMNYFEKEIDMVAIETDGSKGYQRLEGYSLNWNELLPQQIEKLLYTSGVISLGKGSIPTQFKTSSVSPREIENIVIHSTDSEPYNISLNILLKNENMFNFIEGIKILKKIMPNAKVYLALNKEKKKIYKRIKELTSDLDKFSICPVIPKYPQGYDEILALTLLGKRIPYKHSITSIKTVVLSAQTVIHAYETVTKGKPLIERTIAICGPSFKENIHIKARIGTPLDFIIKDKLKGGPSRIILNSLLTGLEINDSSLPMGKNFSQLIAIPDDKERKLLAFLRPGARTDSYTKTFSSNILNRRKLISTNTKGEERPCIQCSFCIEVCPVRIIPALVDRYIRLGINDTLIGYKIFDCIDCNLCSYVCPSKIPLAKNIEYAKTKLRNTKDG